MVASGLNPLAPVFVPLGCAQQVNSGVNSGSTDKSPLSDTRGFGELPDEVLATILSCLDQPKEVMACALASRHIKVIAEHAPLRLCISSVPKLYEDWQEILQAIARHFQGVQMLDLSNTMVDDTDISHLTAQCHNLRTLKLAGCRKLMSLDALLRNPESGLRLEILSLQRCFQIPDSALAELLHAAASTKQQLRCIALSHLLLLHWPKAVQSSPAEAEDELASSSDSSVLHSQHISTSLPSLPGGPGLQALALHNCHGITPQGLQAIAAACPQLQMLFLGGSTMQVPKQSKGSSVAGRTYVPMLNSIPRSRAATIAGVLKKAPSCFHPSAQPVASELLKIVLQLPQLLLIEITFLPYGVRSELRSLLVDSHSSRPLHVLDLCESKSIAAALGLTNNNSLLSKSTGTHEREAKDCSLASHLALLLDAAANCSNAVRQTPLHVAVDVDDANAVEGLLQLGSGVNARDKGGATPLFVACESGHTACAKLLLHVGADVLLRNSAGEAPLYIAALRGEIMVVDALLHHMQVEGISWQDGQLYGDGWTPLMAAAVADRHSVAVRLLSAAGSAVVALVRHANRYGQTAVHIAARKGSLPLLTALLSIGGPAVASTRDCVGTSPADIASKNNHTAAVELLCSVAANVHTPKTLTRSQCWLK